MTLGVNQVALTMSASCPLSSDSDGIADIPARRLRASFGHRGVLNIQVFLAGWKWVRTCHSSG
jgi:hypothetical protein